MRDSSSEKIRIGLKIRIEDGHKFIVFGVAAIHSGLEITGLVTISENAMPIDNVGTRFLPLEHLLFNQGLRCWIIGIVKHLNQNL